MKDEKAKALDWVKPFYEQQNEWFQAYLGPVDEQHYQCLARGQRFTGIAAPAQVLELGAGGGQTCFAFAQAGYQCTMIELVQRSAQHAQSLAEELPEGQLNVICGDFYTVELPKKNYDLIFYLDSFGIGEDADQQRLLKRIAQWLKPSGKVWIEVGSTLYWAGRGLGQLVDLGGIIREHRFEAQSCRLLDEWYVSETPQKRFQQSLRCYTLADFQLLLQGTGLRLLAWEAGGYVDYERLIFVEQSDLQDCMTFHVLLGLDELAQG
jgi:SAM-dependent methyltransferase